MDLSNPHVSIQRALHFIHSSLERPGTYFLSTYYTKTAADPIRSTNSTHYYKTCLCVLLAHLYKDTRAYIFVIAQICSTDVFSLQYRMVVLILLRRNLQDCFEISREYFDIFKGKKSVLSDGSSRLNAREVYQQDRKQASVGRTRGTILEIEFNLNCR